MKKIAIIGGGAAGLGAAWALHKNNDPSLDFTMYEAAASLGGHATTIDFPTAAGSTPVDMGVILTSPALYPNLYALLAELGIETFGVAVDFGASFGSGEVWVTGRRQHGRLWSRIADEAARCEAQLLDVLDLPPASPELLTPLSRLLAGYSRDFVDKVLLPLLSLFVVTRTSLLEMPAAFAASYLRAVSFFSPTPWRLIRGGTRAYTQKLTALFGPRLRLGVPVARVQPTTEGVLVTTQAGQCERYEQVVLAVDAPTVLALLGDPDEATAKVLSAFEYEDATVYLHSDAGLLSRDLPEELLSQYVCEDAPAHAQLTGTMTYNLGAALGIETALVTVVGSETTARPQPERVVAKQRFRHARVTGRGLLAQRTLAKLQGQRGLWFCGAYAAAPTHEAALVSGMAIASRLGAALPYATRAGARRSVKQHAGLYLQSETNEAPRAEAKPSPRPFTNPFLTWNFGPWREENDYARLEVEGEIPAALLGGTLLRIGPNPAFDPIEPRRYIWFDGDGMISAVRFDHPAPSFRNRYVKTLRYELERAAGRPLFGTILSAVRETTAAGWQALGLGDSEVAELLSRVDRKLGPTPEQYERIYPILNGANTALARIGGRLLALEEAGRPYRIEPASLDTLGEETLTGGLRGPVSAHPITDPQSGETYALGYSPFAPHVRVYVIDAAGRVTATVPISLPQPVMMHSFALTERYVVLFDLPTTYLPEDIGSSRSLRWRPELGARLGVLPRAAAAQGHADVRWFEIPLGWLFHVLNAFDEETALVLDVCRYDRVPIIEARPTDQPPPALVRWRLDLRSGSFEANLITGAGAEFPTLDDRWRCRLHRHGYVVTQVNGSLLPNAITHVDLQDGRSQTYHAREGCFVGEALFTPRAPASPEGDGYLLSLAYDAAENRSEVLILDATAVSRGPIATVKLPRRVPFDFHGIFLPPGSEAPAS